VLGPGTRTPTVFARQSHLAVVEAQHAVAAAAEFPRMLARFKLFRRVGQDAEVELGIAPHPDAFARRVGELGPEHIRAVAGFLRLDIREEEIVGRQRVATEKSRVPAVRVILVRPAPQPSHPVVGSQNLRGHADPRQRRQPLARGLDLERHADLPGVGEGIDQRADRLARRGIGERHQHAPVAVDLAPDRDSTHLAAHGRLAPHRVAHGHAVAAVVVGRRAPKVGRQRRQELLDAVNLPGLDRAARLADAHAEAVAFRRDRRFALVEPDDRAARHVRERRGLRIGRHDDLVAGDDVTLLGPDARAGCGEREIPRADTYRIGGAAHHRERQLDRAAALRRHV